MWVLWVYPQYFSFTMQFHFEIPQYRMIREGSNWLRYYVFRILNISWHLYIVFPIPVVGNTKCNYWTNKEVGLSSLFAMLQILETDSMLFACWYNSVRGTTVMDSNSFLSIIPYLLDSRITFPQAALEYCEQCKVEL